MTAAFSPRALASAGGSRSLKLAAKPDHWPVTMTQPSSISSASNGFVEEVELEGHIIDSLLLPKVLDEILTHGGQYTLKHIAIGQRPSDISQARIEVRAQSAAALREILDSIHDHGAAPAAVHDCVAVAADIDSAFPDDFYATTNFRTQVRLGGD